MDKQFNAKSYWENCHREYRGLQGVGCVRLGRAYNKWLYRVRQMVFNAQVRSLKINLNDLRVLDVGSGTGFYLDLWKSLGVKDITGSDIANAAVERLRKLNPNIPVAQLDIGEPLETQRFRENRFDAVSAMDILFHIVDENAFRQAFLNLSNLLKPGGYFIFSDNFLHGKTSRNEHQISRPIEEISSILEEAGFCIVKRAPMFILMNYPVDTRTAIPLQVWRLAFLPVRLLNLFGYLYGLFLFPLEAMLVKILKESPSTEIMICQKIR